jgi:hypothetical protein
VSVVARPTPEEYAPYYEQYVAAAGDGDPMRVLAEQERELSAMLGGLSSEASAFRYAPDKWSIREVLGHVIDAERVFAYRALRFGRADETPLPGFDQNDWARATNAGERSLDDLLAEFRALRAATVAMFRGFPDEAFSRGGVASDNRVTVRALLYIMIGHAAHHIGILRDRYLAHPHFPA